MFTQYIQPNTNLSMKTINHPSKRKTPFFKSTEDIGNIYFGKACGSKKGRCLQNFEGRKGKKMSGKSYAHNSESHGQWLEPQIPPSVLFTQRPP